jgi:hypothetical protein
MDKTPILTEDGAGASLLRTVPRDEGFLLFPGSAGREGSLLDMCMLGADAVGVAVEEGVLGNSSEETGKVIALEAGADDYRVKPFASREPIARLHAIVQRRGVNRASVVGFDNILVDRVNRIVVSHCQDSRPWLSFSRASGHGRSHKRIFRLPTVQSNERHTRIGTCNRRYGIKCAFDQSER